MVDEDEEKVKKWENEEKKKQELQAIEIYRLNIGENFEKKLIVNQINWNKSKMNAEK
jgi:hypothetical protein